MNIIENIGLVDRLIRIASAIFFVVAFFQGLTSGIVGISLLIVAFVFLVTAIFGVCPIYKMLGLHSNSRTKSL